MDEKLYPAVTTSIVTPLTSYTRSIVGSKYKRTGALGAKEIKYSESKEGQREDDCKKFSKGLTSQARTGQGKAKQNIDMI